jgi:hypothetical protein
LFGYLQGLRFLGSSLSLLLECLSLFFGLVGSGWLFSVWIGYILVFFWGGSGDNMDGRIAWFMGIG